MDRSESIEKIFPAFVKAQSTMGKALKKSVNPHFRSRYADLSDVIDAISEPFAENELAFMQSPIVEQDKVTVKTMIVHSSGEWISGEVVIPNKNQTPHAIGSAITYGRRYGLTALAGVAQDDDDGHEASNKSNDKNIANNIKQHQQEQKHEDEKANFEELRQGIEDATTAKDIDSLSRRYQSVCSRFIRLLSCCE